MPALRPQDLDAEFVKAVNADDLDALMALYEDDATMMADGAMIQGKAAIRQSLSGLLALKPQIDLKTVSVLQGASNLALLESRWTVHGTAPDGSPVDLAGSAREVARRHASGVWLYVLDDPGTGK